MTLPKFELRRITYNSRLSEETSAYAADLYVDGKLFAHVSNSGHGGCDMQHPAKGKTYADVQALDKLIKETTPARDSGMVIKGEPFMMESDLETVCGELLATHLITKDLQRLLKRTIAYYDPAKNVIQVFKGKHEGVARAHLVTETMRKHPDAKILNNLPFDEALELFRKAA